MGLDVGEACRYRYAAVLVDEVHNYGSRRVQRDAVSDRDEDRLSGRTAPDRPAENLPIVDDVGIVAPVLTRFGIGGVIGDSVECLGDAYCRNIETERRMCGDAHHARMEYAVSVENEKVWLRRKLSDSFFE